MELEGIEPSYPACKAGILPLNYSPMKVLDVDQPTTALSVLADSPLIMRDHTYGGTSGSRTHNLLHAMQVISQLIYGPKGCTTSGLSAVCSLDFDVMQSKSVGGAC